MKEIKFIEANETYKVELKNGVKLKPFYTIAEMTAIIDDMKSKDNALGRYFSKVVLTAIYNTNIDWTGFNHNEVFDACSELGLIDEFEYNIDMFHRFDDIIKQDESTYKLIGAFVDSLGDKLEGFDMAKIQDGFTGLKEVIK